MARMRSSTPLIEPNCAVPLSRTYWYRSPHQLMAVFHTKRNSQALMHALTEPGVVLVGGRSGRSGVEHRLPRLAFSPAAILYG